MSYLTRLSAFICIFALFCSPAFAQLFDFEITAIEDRIKIDEFAHFNLTVTNNLDRADEFKVSTTDFPTWDVRTDPIVNPITLDLEPGESGTVELVVDPLKIKDIGTFAVNINIRSRELDLVVPTFMQVSVISTDGLVQGLTPTVVSAVVMPSEVDPREPIHVQLVLRNQNKIVYDDLKVKVLGNLFSEEISVALDANEEKLIELEYQLDDLTPPQTDRITYTIEAFDKSLTQPITKDIEVLPYRVQEQIAEEKSFFVTKTRHQLTTNEAGAMGTIKVQTTNFGPLFASTHPRAEVVREEGDIFFVWELEVPDSSIEVQITRNLIPSFVLIALVALLIIGYFIVRSPLAINKKFNHFKEKEGGITEVTIALELSNRGNEKIKHITVTDEVPGIIAVEKAVEIGSIEPKKIFRKGSHTHIQWSVDGIDPGEDRVLSYRVKSKVSIIGGFSVGSAWAKMKYKGRTRKSRSNRLTISN